MAADIKKIIVIFKTHLDVGFTDLSENIINRYLSQYIPKAMELAEQSRRNNPENRFIWTTGSWLIDRYLQSSNEKDRKKMESAIAHGDISWHGLPFTTHTEMMSEELFEYGLSISESLDRAYGIHTIAAKMTDVPGHTKAMVPLLANAGIEFLHIGVNPASTAPDVPVLFRWKTEDSEITVMYNRGSYGCFTPIEGSETAVYFAHTNDNMGPPTQKDIDEMYSTLRKEYPYAEIKAGTLNDAALEIRKIRHLLPVVSGEIGDTWIHGTSSSPKRLSQYRALLRYAPSLPKESRDGMFRELLMIPEHTWGLDEKTFLNDHHHMKRSEFEEVRSAPEYRMMERSWAEQDHFVDAAVESLSGAERSQAEERTAQYKIPPISWGDCIPVPNPLGKVQIENYTVQFEPDGSIGYLTQDGRVLADSGHVWGRIIYELFSENEHRRFCNQYVVSDADWAVEDFGKIGMEEAIHEYRKYTPKMSGLFEKDNQLIAKLEFPSDACGEFGAPKSAALIVTFEEHQIKFDFAWWEKPANRTPEALWFQITPMDSSPEVRKLGRWISPNDVVKNGNKKLFGTDWGVRYKTICVESLDAGTVAVGSPSLWDFNNDDPDDSKGLFFNLYNNLWGTNFTMWYDQDARFRWIVHV